MFDLAVFWAWIEFALRWLHAITAIAWIGSSFYFIALDLGLRRDKPLEGGADGEEWQVHGGGFYHIRKYTVAPPDMPEHLTWFKWESYATWLSGFALLVVLYWFGAEFYLIDRQVADLAVWQAAGISIGSLIVGWLVYDQMCKSPIGQNTTLLMVCLFGLIVAMALFYTSVFSGRAALLHLGAFTATLMTGNVAHIIIPNQKIVVADLIAGRTPDAKYGYIAKQRSTHNNYLTLPVIFLMLSNHYPLAFGTQYAWAIASLVFLMGVTIRHWFNTVHARKGHPHWTWGATAVIFLVLVWLSTAGQSDGQQTLSDHARPFAEAPQFAEVADVVTSRCSMCHAQEPVWIGLHWPPKGVRLETEAEIAHHAREIFLQAGISHAMPPGNLSNMTQPERDLITAWFRDVRYGGN
jgi:uncharacterized membrane protein